MSGENVPNFKANTSEGTSASNVFHILQDLHLKQYQDRCHLNTMQNDSRMFHTDPYNTTNASNTVENMAQLATSFTTTTPSTAMTENK